jgi:leucyl/phenylalanyl-tRNA--protein transferase
MGPDPDFPFLSENQRFNFPPPEKARHHRIVASGGNLSPGMLLSAYEQGLFPWYGEGEPVIWHSPDPRFVIFPEKLHVSRSMQKILRQKKFAITLNQNFQDVITSCSQAKRPGQNGTWITSDMIEAYTELHRLGFAHSAEAYLDGELAGGCYGVLVGKVFFGESMFTLKPNASKAAFIILARMLFEKDVRLIDCQQHTPHLESLGAEDISRTEFLALLRDAVKISII